MPYSGPFCNDIVEHFLRQVELRNFLDIGAGNGKYGTMVRRIHPRAFATAVEIEGDYVERFKLREIYDTVRVMDADDLLKTPDADWDFVMLGDVIEHMRKSKGLDLLNFLVYRAKWIIVIYPEAMIQNSWEGYASEAHISVWHESDFAAFDAGMIIREHQKAVLIDGYQAHEPRRETLLRAIALA
jgi:SAM-dependent methyltransferase